MNRCRCGHEQQITGDPRLEICPMCARQGCWEPIDSEWLCPECGANGKYWEIPRNSGVEQCPDCRSILTNIE